MTQRDYRVRVERVRTHDITVRAAEDRDQALARAVEQSASESPTSDRVTATISEAGLQPGQYL